MNRKIGVIKITIVFISIAVSFYALATFVVAGPVKKKLHTTVHGVSAWKFKREIAIENRGAQLTDAVIQIQLKESEFDFTKTKSDGADIRFSTQPEKLNGDGLSYWIEQWNDNGITIIWVKVPIVKSPGQTVYMYYGNTSARSVSNGNNTFLFFDDFEDGNYSQKWPTVSIGQVAEQDGMLKLRETDGEDGIIATDFDVKGQMIVRTCYQRGGADQHWVRAGVGGWNNWLCFGDHTDWAATGTNYVMLFDSLSISSLKSAPIIKSPNKVITDKWRKVSYWYDGKNLKGMQDDVMVTWPAINASSKLALRTLDNDSWDNFAYITVSTYSSPEPVVTIGKEKRN